MKNPITILFAIYFLIAACYPCGDAEVCVDDVDKVMVSDSHQHSEDEIDSCSPFCVCNCCRANLHPPKNYAFNNITISTSKDYQVLFLSSVEDISYSFWQPPKI